MTTPTSDPTYGQPSFKKPAECKFTTWMSKRSSNRPSTATSNPNDQSFKNKDAHPDQTRRDSECFSNPKRNKLSQKILFILLILFCSIVNADKSHSSQPCIQDLQHLVAFKKIGLTFNPTNLSGGKTILSCKN
jgi:hypothetical protein